MASDHYAVLGVSRQAEPDEIRDAYWAIARVNHPDRTGNDPAKNELFKLATEAFKILSDPEARSQYDFGFNPITSVQDLFSRHRAGRNVMDIMLPSAPAVPQRGVDVAFIVNASLESLSKGGSVTIAIRSAEGKAQEMQLMLPEQAHRRPWCRLRKLGGLGRNLADNGDLWVLLASAIKPKAR